MKSPIYRSFAVYRASFFDSGKIPDTTPISERPAGAENRSRYGHWESDTVLGMRKTGCFGAHVERKSGYPVAFQIDDRQDNAFNHATIKAFSSIPEKLKRVLLSITGKNLQHIKHWLRLQA